MKYIYGLQKSGISLANYLYSIGEDFYAWDDNKNVRNLFLLKFNDIKLRKPKELNFSIIKEAYITPGISFNNVNLSLLNKYKISLFRDLDYYLSIVKKEKILAITGTNGKSTTTKLISDLIKQNKDDCFVGGNIGVPLLDFKLLNDKSNFHVIELSSFQLESIKKIDSYISVLLNLSHDHLDRYRSFEDYIKAKKKILNMNKNSFNIISVDDNFCKKIYKELKNTNKIAISLNRIKKGIYFLDNCIHDNFFYENKIIHLGDLSESLQGKINIQNILATYAVSEILKFNITNFHQTLKFFKGLPHRLEVILNNKELIVVNNSKATNIDSTLNSINDYENIYLILGGKLKQDNFTSILDFKHKIKTCYLIGESSNIIFNQIKFSVDSKICNTLEIAIENIILDLSQTKNDIKSTILFSPACSSFDQFLNFEERGNAFKTLIAKNFHKK